MWIIIDKFSDKRLSLIIAVTVFLGVLVFFLPVLLISFNQIVTKGETRYTQLEVNRAEKIITYEAARLDHTLQDWANWDDTYQFARDGNAEYIESYLSDSAFINLDTDIFLVLNPAKEVVYTKYVDRISQVEAPLPLDLQPLFLNYPKLHELKDIQSAYTGLAFSGGYPLMVAARPILTSNAEGPVGGTLIFIRLLDRKELDEYSNLAQRKLDLFAVGSQPPGMPALPAPAELNDSVFIHPLNSQIMTGYRYLMDLNQQPVLVLQVQTPRDLYAQGQKTAAVFSVALLLLGFALFGGTYHFSRTFLTSQRTGRKYLKRFQSIVNQSSEAILLVGADCHILEANPASKELLNWPLDQDTAPCLKTLLTFEPDLDETMIREITQSGKTAEYHCVRHDGVSREIELSASLIEDADVQAFSLILHDITDRKQAENALKASEERYMLTSTGANDGLWDWDLISGKIYLSPRWKAMLGYEDDEIRDLLDEWFDRVHPDDLALLQTQLSNHLRNHSEHFECEYRILQKNGQYAWMLARGVAVWDADGYANRIAGSQTDVRDRKKVEEQLRYDALHDALTGLGNRTLLIDHLQHVNERKRRDPNLAFALFFLDLDRFKQVNDSFGHHAGDQLLIEVSHRLGVGLRNTDTVSRLTRADTVARIAGDEFVILLEDFHSNTDIQKVAERVTRLLNTPYLIDGQEITVTASIGLVVPEAPYENAEDIIRDADIAMYRAKQLGGAQVVKFNNEMYQGTIVRIQLENDLRRAVERQEFDVVYQPIYTLDNDHIAGLEALVRWKHPQKGLLLPEEFIKAAEEIGVIIPIGYFVLEEACQQMKTWQQAGLIHADVIISVNLSARQLMHIELVENICAILKKTGFDANLLWLEVTESTLVENSELVLTRLNELKALGIRIEIDDFGTGYSSLSYLQNLPIDGFKIDQSFIKDIHGGGQQIIKSLIELGHSLGLIEVAEGVETQKQKEYLKSVSCDYAQGYLMSRPVSAQMLEELIQKR